MKIRKKDGWLTIRVNQKVTLLYHLESGTGGIDVGADADACHVCGCYHFDGTTCRQEEFDRRWGDVVEKALEEAVNVDSPDGVYEI